MLLLNQIKTESEVVNMVDSDTISLQIKNLYQTIFAVPLAQGVTNENRETITNRKERKRMYSFNELSEKHNLTAEEKKNR